MAVSIKAISTRNGPDGINQSNRPGVSVARTRPALGSSKGLGPSPMRKPIAAKRGRR